MDLGERKIPSSDSEPLSDARTPLAGFFSILPILHLHYAEEPGIEGSITIAL
jgi:hypothetical protein